MRKRRLRCACRARLIALLILAKPDKGGNQVWYQRARGEGYARARVAVIEAMRRGVAGKKRYNVAADKQALAAPIVSRWLKVT